METKLENLWVLEWSISQKAFHVDSMTKILKKNTIDMNAQQSSTWIPVAVSRDPKELVELSIELHKKFGY